MGTSKSVLANQDLRALLDRALESPRGVELSLPTLNAAYTLRHRIYSLRETDRGQSRDLYPPDDPKHGVSVYDILTIVLRKANDQEEDTTHVLSILKESIDWSAVKDL